MNESHNQRIDVPELSPEEIQARVLHRDGLMLVIDKPAGLPVHRGPKGGANLEASFDALRFGLPRPPVLAHRLDRDTSGCLVLGRHRKATASLGLLFKHGKISKTYWAVVEGGPGRGPRHHRHAARPPQRRTRLVAKARPGRPAGRHQLEGAGARRRPRLARDGAGDRPHASVAGPCVRDGLADRRRQHLWQRRPRFGEPTLHLHSRGIVVPISKNKEPVSVIAPAPAHLHERLQSLRLERRVVLRTTRGSDRARDR